MVVSVFPSTTIYNVNQILMVTWVMIALIWPRTEAGKCWAVVAGLTMAEVCMTHSKNACALWCILHGIVTCTVLSNSASERIKTAGMWCDFPPTQHITPLLGTMIYKACCKPKSGYAGTLSLFFGSVPHTLYWSRQQSDGMISISASRLGCPMYWSGH